MTNSRMSLADFLRARIAADEVQARIATGRLGNEGADRSARSAARGSPAPPSPPPSSTPT